MICPSHLFPDSSFFVHCTSILVATLKILITRKQKCEAT